MNPDTGHEALRQTLWRAVVVMLGMGALFYAASAYSIAIDPEHRSPTGNVVGVDYSAYHAAATMLRYGDADQLYDLDAMTELLRDVRQGPTSREPTYLYPPALATVLTPVAPLRYEVGLALWSALGIAAFFLGLRAINARAPALLVGAVLLSVPGFLGVSLGQGHFYWAAIYAGVLSRLRAGKSVHAGLLAALLILKPQLLVPVVLWWILDWRRCRRALVAVALGVLVISLVPTVLFSGAYDGYPAMLRAAAEAFPLNGIPMGVTLRYMVSAFTGGFSAWSSGIVIVGFGFLVAVLVRGVRACWSTEMMFIVATTGGLLVLPHLLAYDWVLLVPAGVVFVQLSPTRTVLLPAMIVGLLGSLTFQVVFGIASYERFGRGIQVAPLVLLLALFAAVRQLLRTPEAINTA